MFPEKRYNTYTNGSESDESPHWRNTIIYYPCPEKGCHRNYRSQHTKKWKWQMFHSLIIENYKQWICEKTIEKYPPNARCQYTINVSRKNSPDQKRCHYWSHTDHPSHDSSNTRNKFLFLDFSTREYRRRCEGKEDPHGKIFGWIVWLIGALRESFFCKWSFSESWVHEEDDRSSFSISRLFDHIMRHRDERIWYIGIPVVSRKHLECEFFILYREDRSIW